MSNAKILTVPQLQRVGKTS